MPHPLAKISSFNLWAIGKDVPFMCYDGWRHFTCCKKTWQVHNTSMQCQKQPADLYCFLDSLMNRQWYSTYILYCIMQGGDVNIQYIDYQTQDVCTKYFKVGGLISEIMVTTIVNVTTCMVMRVCLISNVETQVWFPDNKMKAYSFWQIKPFGNSLHHSRCIKYQNVLLYFCDEGKKIKLNYQVYCSLFILVGRLKLRS